MNCPNCKAEMTVLTLDGRLGNPLAVDLCSACQGFWFDKYEDLQLAASSVLTLMKRIGDLSRAAVPAPSGAMHCPRCPAALLVTSDMQRSTRFSYWRCPKDHGRFIRFFEFLKEKNFIRPLSPRQLADLRVSVQSIHCSSCGAPVDLNATSTCSHCGAAVSMLDMGQSKQLLEELQAAGSRTVDPDLSLKLEEARRIAESACGPDGSDLESSSLVHAGLNAVAHWLSEAGF